MNRNLLAFVLTVISIGLLIPGLLYPILEIKIGAELPMLGELVIYERTQNILETTKTLYENNNEAAAILIIFFSVIVPFIKAIIVCIVLFLKNIKQRRWLYMFVNAIGKWSMADVFVVGVFIAYLTTKNNDNIIADLKTGFYYFSGYCIVSLAAIQLISIDPKEKNQS